MRTIFLLCLFSTLYSAGASTRVDSLKYEMRYTKEDLSKVKNELSSIQQMIKSWKKASKSKNLDFQNNIFTQIKSMISEQSSELSSNIARRDKRVSNLHNSYEAVDSLTYVEMPVGYNVELNNRPREITKEDFQSRQQESGVLSKYTTIVSAQKQVLSKLNSIGSIKKESPESLQQVTSLLKEYVLSKQDQIALMKTETK